MRSRLFLATMAIVFGIAVVASASSCGDSHDAGKAEMKMEKKAEAEMGGSEEMMEMPFGGDADVAFAEALWVAMDGYQNWMMQSRIMPGKSPHGMFVRLYYSIVNIEGVPYHVVVKDNYGGEGVTLDTVKASPADYLMAVTPMVQRESGYDEDNRNWFYVKFSPDGSIDKNDKDVAMAGRVAKGMPVGCIACHANAADGDYLFAND
jgi:hypothetical protein